MKLSVIVPTYKPRDIMPLLSGLLQQSDQDFELVVVENGSEERSLAHQLECCAFNLSPIYKHEKKSGLNKARNLGVLASSGSHIAFIDDDCRPDHYWVANLKEAHRQYPSAGVIGGRVLLKHEKPPPFWLNTEFRRSLAELDYGDELKALGRWQYLVGANLSFSRTVFDEVCGFQEGFGLNGDEAITRANDEAEFIQKAGMRGLPGAVYAGAAVVEHHVPFYRTKFESLLIRRFGQGVSDVEYDILQSGFNRALRLFYTQVFQSRWHLNELEKYSSDLSEDESMECMWRGMLARVVYLMGIRERLISSTPVFNVFSTIGTVESTAYRRGREMAGLEVHNVEKPLATELLQRILYEARTTISPFTRVAMAAGVASHDLNIRLQAMGTEQTLP